MAKTQSKRIRLIVGLIIVAAGIYVVFFVDWKKKEVKEVPPSRPLKMITVGQAVSGQVRKYPGKVAAIDRVTLAFQVDGPLIELPIRKGQEVKKGDLLARIDPRDFQNRRDSAKAEREQTSTQLERIKKAAVTGAVSQTELTNAQAAFDRADANFEIAQKALEDTKMLAPFDAVIGNIFVDNFQNVLAKEEIVTVQKIENVVVEVNVPEERILRAKEKRGQYRFVAVFDSLPGREFETTLYEYATEADPLTQTYLVRFSMPAPKDVTILPGMTGTILEYPKETDQQAGVFLIPVDAVPVEGSGQYYVWKAQPKDSDLYTVHQQKVEVGAMEGDNIRILSGLSQGDKIAASGVHMLQEGQEVREFIPKSEESGR
jgi:RND family efflux transporter MFP subunit